MKSFKILRIGIAAGIAVAALLCTTGQAAAQESKPSKIGTVVLVHGAWADGSSWTKVIPRLEEKGLNVVAVQLPLTSLANDVATVPKLLSALSRGLGRQTSRIARSVSTSSVQGRLTRRDSASW